MRSKLCNKLRIEALDAIEQRVPLTDYIQGKATELYSGRINLQDLLRQVLLHLHRFSINEFTEPSLIDNEIKRQADKLIAVKENPSCMFMSSGQASVDLHHSRLDIVDPSTAQFIHQVHHYLGSFRGDGIHLGLYSNEQVNHRPRLMSIVSLSPFDLSHIADALPLGLRQEQVLVLSRLFAFDWCPHNTISYSLGRVFEWLRERLPHIKMLLTYLNPNLGFTGTVYKATNWVLFGRESKRRYLYLDSNYVTDRHMIRAYGTADLERLRVLLGDRVLSSVLPLRPLEVYAYFLDSPMRKRNMHGFSYEFEPRSELVGREKK